MTKRKATPVALKFFMPNEGVPMSVNLTDDERHLLVFFVTQALVNESNLAGSKKLVALLQKLTGVDKRVVVEETR